MGESKPSEARRVFILGAGFSKPAGFPLATELTDEVLAELRRLVGTDYGLFRLAEHLHQLQQWTQRTQTMRPLNIEEFYEYASIVAERLRCDQHTVEVGRNAGETPFRQADDIETWLKYLDEHLLDVLMRHENTADLESIRRFVSVLRPVDSIVSFNYDRLVERCLGDEQQWSFGIDPDLIGLPVLKLHGSFDWVCFGTRSTAENEPLSQAFQQA